MRDVARSLACAFGALVILAVPAGAQEAPSASVEQSAAQPAAQSTPVSPGTLTVERVPSGWVISPDVTMTEFNKEVGTLIGAYGGWLSDRTWLLGMGGYWLAIPALRHGFYCWRERALRLGSRAGLALVL